jgi:hypothetical protein
LTQFLLNPDELPVLKRLILNDSLLSPVARYLGEVPVLQTAAFWHSTNTSFAQNSSQFFHIDGEGLEQVKIFIPLDNIDENQGPFTLIPAEASDLLVKKLLADGSIRTRSDRVDDEVVHAASDFIVLTGSLGDIFYVDTNHCYHFGSRPNGVNNKPRLLLQLHFTRHTSADLPTFNRGYSVKSDDELEDLILKPLRSGKLWLFFKGRYKYFPIDRFLKGSPKRLSKIDFIAK